MFALVHFSRVFPYIHPYLFPIESAEATASPEAAFPEPVASPMQCGEEASVITRAGQNKRQKSLYRRQFRNQRNDALTYCGAYRHAG